MDVTIITTAQGRVIEAAMKYDDAKISMAARKMTADDGMREIVKVDGTRTTINIGAIVQMDEGATIEKRAIGFR
jgi:hypothetical protein